MGCLRAVVSSISRLHATVEMVFFQVGLKLGNCNSMHILKVCDDKGSSRHNVTEADFMIFNTSSSETKANSEKELEQFSCILIDSGVEILFSKPKRNLLTLSSKNLAKLFARSFGLSFKGRTCSVFGLESLSIMRNKPRWSASSIWEQW